MAVGVGPTTGERAVKLEACFASAAHYGGQVAAVQGEIDQASGCREVAGEVAGERALLGEYRRQETEPAAQPQKGPQA